MIVSLLDFDTNEADLASEASGRQVLVFDLDLNTDQENLASDALEGKC